MKKVLNYFTKFLKYKELADSCYIARAKDKYRGMRQIKVSQISLSDTHLNIQLNHHTVGFLKRNSPISKAKNMQGEMSDQNKLLIGLVFFKITDPEKEEDIYIPVISYDITEQKEFLFKNALINGIANLSLQINKRNLIVNQIAIDNFFDMKSNFAGEEVNDYISESLETLIPEKYRKNIIDMFNYIQNYFTQYLNKDAEVIFPSIVNEKSIVGMFFTTKEEFKQAIEFQKVKNSEELVKQYLTKSVDEPKEFNQKISNIVWTGSLTKDYPLGEGQAIVLQINQQNKKIIPVIGGPGTGKTTLFLSVIAQEITKRAVNLIQGNEDYNNLMIVTSTSNKAVENIYKSLKKGFKHGFVYIGGNQENKTKSKIDVQEFINWFITFEYSKEKEKEYKKSIISILNFFKRKEKEFKEIKQMQKILNIASFHDLMLLRNQLEADILKLSWEDYEKKFKIIQENIKKINYLSHATLDIYDVEDLLHQDIPEKLAIILDKIEHSSIFKKLFSKKKMIEEETRSIGFSVDNVDNLELLVQYFQNIVNNDLSLVIDIFEKKREIEQLNKYVNMFEKTPKKLDRILKSDNWGDFFRTNLYSLNYRLYLKAYNYLFQIALKDKYKVIKAVKYLIADNGFQYIKENFGYKKEDIEEMLRLISLVYPVSTSTLASISSMFNGIYPEKCITYNTILADEAGMINVMDMIPVMRRANRAIIVGDPKQLPPIVSIEDFFYDTLNQQYDRKFIKQYSPTEVSAYHRAAGTKEGGYKNVGDGYILDEHRRCTPKIAQLFINIADYKGLKVCTKKPNNKAFKNIKEELFFFDVKNQDNNDFRKVNYEEINFIRRLLSRLQKAGYNLQKDVGIITPYREQESALIENFGQILNHTSELAKIGTVHKFQGAEYKVVIFSTVVSKENDSLSFINSDPSMINVAVSRAKEIFMVVGDYHKLTSDKDMDNFAGRMAEFIKKHGVYAPTKGK